MLHDYLIGKAPLVGDVDVIEESNGRERFKHLHAVAYMAITEGDIVKMQKVVRQILGIGKGLGMIKGKVQIKRAPTPSGAMEYLAKGARSNFRFIGNTNKTLDSW